MTKKKKRKHSSEEVSFEEKREKLIKEFYEAVNKLHLLI